MRSSTDDKNLVIGMNDNKDIDAYEIDIPLVDSNYNIDKDSGKMVDSIDAVVNPSLENSKVSGDKVTNLKKKIQSVIKNFLQQAI